MTIKDDKELIQWKDNSIIHLMVFYHILVILCSIGVGVLIVVGLVTGWMKTDLFGKIFSAAVLIIIIAYTIYHLINGIKITPRRIGVSIKGIHIVSRHNEERFVDWKNIELISGEKMNKRYCKWKLNLRNSNVEDIGIIKKEIGVFLSSFFVSTFPELASAQKEFNEKLTFCSEWWASLDEVPKGLKWISNSDYYFVCFIYVGFCLAVFAAGCFILYALAMSSSSTGIFWGIGFFVVILGLCISIVYIVIRKRIRKVAADGAHIFLYYHSKKIRILFISSIKNAYYYTSSAAIRVANALSKSTSTSSPHLYIEFIDGTSMQIYDPSSSCVNLILYAVESGKISQKAQAQ